MTCTAALHSKWHMPLSETSTVLAGAKIQGHKGRQAKRRDLRECLCMCACVHVIIISINYARLHAIIFGESICMVMKVQP